MNYAFLFALLGILMLVLALAGLAVLAVAHFRLASKVSLLEKAQAPAPSPAPELRAAAPQQPALAAVRPAPAATADAPMDIGFPGNISQEDFAIIAAAVNSLLGRAARIIQIAPSEIAAGSHAWSMEGRRSIYQSHNVRR